MYELAISLQENSEKHLYQQIYDYMVREIRVGKLQRGEKLPSTRYLAQYLQISRSTVQLAYEQLVAEGYLEVRAYRGYFVAAIDEIPPLEMGEKYKQKSIQTVMPKSEIILDFSPNGIEKEGFPFSVWKRIQNEVLSDCENDLFTMGDSRGERELREVISRYLYAARGVMCSAENIIVGAGNDYLLLLLDKIMGNKKTVAIEEYSYKKAAEIFGACGYKIVTLSQEMDGISVDKLHQEAVDLLYTMPSHQFPLGKVMPIAKRQEVLAWANEDDTRYIIEDDYDSEFRYKGRPIPALQAMDYVGKVIYMGTFSRTIAPAIRISYMVLPERLMERFWEVAAFYSSTVSKIDQAALTMFLKDGYFERHLNKMRKRYREKYELLVGNFRKEEAQYQVIAANTGLHILIRHKKHQSEEALVRSAAAQGIRVYGLSEYYIGSMSDEKIETNTVLLGYAGLSLDEINKGSECLKQIWKN